MRFMQAWASEVLSIGKKKKKLEYKSYTELKKTAGQYYGIEQLVGSVKECPIYNDPEVIKKS